MTNDRIIATLNDLIEALKDREKGLALAAQNAREPELTRAFGDGETANRAAAAELQDQVRLLGGTAEQGTSMAAAVRRSWTSVRAMVSPRDDATIMEECERDERYVRGRYAEARELDLPGAIRSIVERHHRAIVEGHYRMLDLRNRFRACIPRANPDRTPP
jgi:uncharacterized protein (TIGR02284 family)